MGECENGVECERWLLMASWKEGESGGEGRKERERERDMDSLRYRERGSVKVCS